ncbi:tyrosine-type recombinase/integrase [Candidatus Nitrosotenuis chungbukensis]|uniref:tyrosine-type recombinase/integrase n=1 Tax=Candidatus Nitrosotenuis chungbukensis TaxID=1353246 RepID=UPI0005B281E5|nr:tyrosine-type recombinase/integrase [Candidatus Nitrosotenuis chungbukensis]
MTINESEPMGMFLYALKSPVSKQRYQKRLENFFDFLELQGSTEDKAKTLILQINEHGLTWLTAKTMNYLNYHKERAERGEISDATVRNYYKPLKLFLEMNDVILQWKKITRGLPRGRRYASDRAPTIDEIQKLVEYPDRRIRAIVFTMCSSGIRLGAWDYLKWKDITPISQNDKIIAAKIVVYSGDSEQYFSFISPEAYSELKKWIDFRSESGETITGDSWLMRDLWNIEKFARGMVTASKKLKASGVKRLIERALKAQGIRKTLPAGQKRYEFQADHGFRKFFKTHTEQVMKPINVEVLMGHSTGISDSYYRPNENELLKDYLGAIPEITISKENRMTTDAEKLRVNSSGIEENKNEIAQLKEEIRKIKLKNEISALMKESMIEWAEKHPDKITPLQVAKTDCVKLRNLDEIVEHYLIAHDGDISGLRERFANARIHIKEN